jgi:hypothetical protein
MAEPCGTAATCWSVTPPKSVPFRHEGISFPREYTHYEKHKRSRRVFRPDAAGRESSTSPTASRVGADQDTATDSSSTDSSTPQNRPRRGARKVTWAKRTVDVLTPPMAPSEAEPLWSANSERAPAANGWGSLARGTSLAAGSVKTHPFYQTFRAAPRVVCCNPRYPRCYALHG